jgi:hypothetical protein
MDEEGGVMTAFLVDGHALGVDVLLEGQEEIDADPRGQGQFLN